MPSHSPRIVSQSLSAGSSSNRLAPLHIPSSQAASTSTSPSTLEAHAHPFRRVHSYPQQHGVDSPVLTPTIFSPLHRTLQPTRSSLRPPRSQTSSQLTPPDDCSSSTIPSIGKPKGRGQSHSPPPSSTRSRTRKRSASWLPVQKPAQGTPLPRPSSSYQTVDWPYSSDESKSSTGKKHICTPFCSPSSCGPPSPPPQTPSRRRTSSLPRSFSIDYSAPANPHPAAHVYMTEHRHSSSWPHHPRVHGHHARAYSIPSLDGSTMRHWAVNPPPAQRRPYMNPYYHQQPAQGHAAPQQHPHFGQPQPKRSSWRWP